MKWKCNNNESNATPEAVWAVCPRRVFPPQRARVSQFHVQAHLHLHTHLHKGQPGPLSSAMNDAATSLLTEHFSYTPLVSGYPPPSAADWRIYARGDPPPFE